MSFTPTYVEGAYVLSPDGKKFSINPVYCATLSTAVYLVEYLNKHLEPCRVVSGPPFAYPRSSGKFVQVGEAPWVEFEKDGLRINAGLLANVLKYDDDSYVIPTLANEIAMNREAFAANPW